MWCKFAVGAVACACSICFVSMFCICNVHACVVQMCICLCYMCGVFVVYTCYVHDLYDVLACSGCCICLCGACVAF